MKSYEHEVVVSAAGNNVISPVEECLAHGLGIGDDLLLIVDAIELEDYGKVEQLPKLEGKRMIMMIGPVSKK